MSSLIANRCSVTCCLMLVAAAAALWPLASAVCSPSSGPAGSYECINIPRYNGWQVANCRTNNFIKLKSGGRHVCSDESATYCYYQCMIESHSVNSGAVTPDCSCDPSVTPTPNSAGTTLPPMCYSPTGEDCSWYTDCLERRIQCGPQTGYALSFGKKYCELYAEKYNWFTKERTKRWVDAVRKCLQVSLVPLIREFNPPSCDEVKQKAISSHTDCYMAPAVGQPSMCDVLANSCLDILTIFFTIKGAFVERDWKVFKGTWTSFFKVGWACKIDFLVNCAPKLLIFSSSSVLRAVGITFIILEPTPAYRRRRRSVELDPEQTAMEFVTALGDKLAWKERGIEWIPIAVDSGTAGTINVRLLLGDQRMFNLNRNYSEPMDLQQEVRDLQNSVKSGDLLIGLSDGRKFYAKQLADCGDQNCTEVRISVSAPAETRGVGAVRPLPWVLGALLVLVGALRVSGTLAGGK